MTKDFITIPIEINPPELKSSPQFFHAICDLKNGRLLHVSGTSEKEVREEMTELIYVTLKLGERHLE